MISIDKETVLDFTDDILAPGWFERRDRGDLPGSRGPRLWTTEASGGLRADMLRAIEAAEEVILVTSFLIGDSGLVDALLAAATRRKVRVYMLTASEVLLDRYLDVEEREEKRIREHQEMLHRCQGQILIRTGSHLHAKALLIDPDSEQGWGWISTANLNPALTRNVELAVPLSGEALQAAASWFSWAFWKEADRELQADGRLAQVGSPPADPRAPESSTVLATSSEHTSLKQALLGHIRAARQELIVACYGFEEDHETVEALLERLHAGVKLRILARPRPRIAGAMRLLREAGAEVIAHDTLHAKAIVSETSGIVMTANLEAVGLDAGFELGLALEGEALAELHELLEKWCETFPWELHLGRRRGDFLGRFLPLDKSPRDGVREIVSEELRELQPIEARCASELSSTNGHPGEVPASSTLAHRVRCRWQVRAPRLKENFKKLEDHSSGLEIYGRGERRDILIRSDDELPQAIEVKNELGGEARIVTP